MLTPIIVMLMGAAVARPPQTYKLPPAPPPPRCKGKCAEKYRLPLTSDDTPDMKDRALALDGSKCNVVGAQRCLSKRRVIFRSDQDPMDTWRASFLPQ